MRAGDLRGAPEEINSERRRLDQVAEQEPPDEPDEDGPLVQVFAK